MTRRILMIAIATLISLLVPAVSQAQDAATLPDICMAGAEPEMAAMEPVDEMAAMDDAHHDLMDGMEAMNSDMMKAMNVPDIDVAFVCGMIPHHRGAIDMARAELAHGDNQWARDMAQKVIDAQEQEIAEMIAWLEEQRRP